jgi:hypothetical protein
VTTGYVHRAVLDVGPETDEGAPGAAVTVRLCGHWQHDGPCRWPHHTAVVGRSGASVTVRTVYVCDASEADAVRAGIAAALSAGRLEVVGGPDDDQSWQVVEQGAADPDEDERGWIRRQSA